ncbi:MAG: alpha/beta hydrolase [Bacteroidetes bacterium]|nr:MAG: alpha/beta hydrolase [Bacteroidota bacterium]
MELNYRQYGDGAIPLIILHGLFGLSDNWAGYGNLLGADYTVYIPDLRNHGFSPHDPIMRYEAMASDLEEFMETHAIVNPLLMGHSMGGKVVLQFVKDFPHALRAALVLDISPVRYHLRQVHLDMATLMQSMDMGIYASRREILEVVRGAIQGERLQQFVMKNLYRSGQNTFGWKPNVDAILASLEDISAAIEPPEAVPSVPVKFIRGGESDYVTPEDEEIIQKYWSDQKVESIPHASHWIHVDAPEPLLRAIKKFFASCCG